MTGWKEGNILFNGRKEGRKEMFYLRMHSTDFIYSYMASDYNCVCACVCVHACMHVCNINE